MTQLRARTLGELKGLGMVQAARLTGLVDTETLALPFVGRGAELARLRAQFERTKSGRATLAAPQHGCQRAHVQARLLFGIAMARKAPRREDRPDVSVKCPCDVVGGWGLRRWCWDRARIRCRSDDRLLLRGSRGLGVVNLGRLRDIGDDRWGFLFRAGLGCAARARDDS